MNIWFILLWLWIGASVGILVAALMGAASRARDEDEERREWEELQTAIWEGQKRPEDQ